MAITLGTSIPSYNARTKLNGSTDSITTIMQKLASGLKINGAKDDAAGLVISQNMDANIRGSRQAQMNIQNATSFLTIAEDGMASVNEHFQRINDLLVNMANDTNDQDSRKAAADEIIVRLNEIDRLANSTSFNGKTMLDGSAKEIVVQIGPNSDELTSTLDISQALSDCHVEAFGAKLPGYLNPKALKLADGSVIIPKDEKQDDGSIKTVYYKEADNTEYTGTTTGLESAFDPTNENCRKYMDVVQSAISDVAVKRGLLGAYENRMESSYDSLTARIENLTASKALYTDTDIAQEATNLTNKQILQQVQVSILSQANTMQQMALSLLG